MLWKTDEKALLEKRAEERGKLMLRGRSAARQAAGRKVCCLETPRFYLWWPCLTKLWEDPLPGDLPGGHLPPSTLVTKVARNTAKFPGEELHELAKL